MDKIQLLNVSEIIERMKDACNIKTDAALAAHLDVSNKTISSWKTRNSLPIEAILQISAETKKMVEYFLWGDEDKRPETDFKFSDLRLEDFEIAGETVFVHVLEQFAGETLAFMEEEEVRRHGSGLGVSMMALLAFIRQERRLLLDTGKLDNAAFNEYARKAFRNDLPHNIRAIENMIRKRGDGPQ